MINSGNPERYATYFDANYLPRAISEHDSMLQHCQNFVVYAYCFDSTSYCVVNKLARPTLVPVHPREFLTRELLAHRRGKLNHYEFYWACTPHITEHAMGQHGGSRVTYVDADMRFYADPAVIFQEMGDADILLQPGNYSSEYRNRVDPIGYYCVSWVTFKNTPNSHAALDYWHSRCMEHCSCIPGKGTFGDQKYLDDFATRFERVGEITNPGANVAPWSIGKFAVGRDVNGNPTINGQRLISYHFHGFKFNPNTKEWEVSGYRDNFYELSEKVVDVIYAPYAQAMIGVVAQLREYEAYRDYLKDHPDGQFLRFKHEQKA